MPSDEEINVQIELAFNDGKEACKELGIMCQPPKLTIKMPATQVGAHPDSDTDEIDKEVDQNEVEVDSDTEPIDLQHTFVEAPDSSKSEYGFLKVVSGKTSTLLKKSTILWSMYQTQEKVSQDRRRPFKTNRPVHQSKDGDI